jgi:hypothetical protein
MDGLSLHLAPNAPWVWLVLATLGFAALAVWAYAFGSPPLAPLVRRLLSVLRALSLGLLAWLLAMPVLERALPASGTRVLVLRDRSLSMERPERPGAGTRAETAERALAELRAALRGRARLEVAAFAGALLADSAVAEGERSASAPGSALGALARQPVERRPDGVILLTDGAVNAGEDPVAAARSLGVPVHGLLVGERTGLDRGIAGVEASSEARVGEATPVRVRVVSDEPAGTPIEVRLEDQGRLLARVTVSSPGPGAEALAELRVVPSRPGLALWTARLSPLEGDLSPDDDAHGVAVPVAPGRLGVLVLSAGLNWDLAHLRRALRGDSTVAIETRVREPGGSWRAIERGRTVPLVPGDLAGRAVVALDGLAPAELGGPLDRALAAFVRGGGGLLLLAGPEPGARRYASGALARELEFRVAGPVGAPVAPEPQPAAAELLAWDDDPARGARAWREAAPLADVAMLAPGGADRVLLAGRAAASGGPGAPPLWLARAVGRGQVLLVNGSGTWRWSLNALDDLAGERGRRLWRKTMRWLAEPVHGEPLRVTAERRLVAGGEPVRLDALLQDERFRPVSGAEVQADLSGPGGASRRMAFTAGGPGAYSVSLPSPGPGRWQVSASASRSGRELGRSRTEFFVDRWTLEALRPQPDGAALAGIAAASGGTVARAAEAGRWARSLDMRALVRRRSTSTRLWESPWLFAVVVAMLSTEWAWRRRRGLM